VRVLNFLRGTSNRRNAVAALTLIVCTLFSNEGAAQIQQAWVAKYNNGITNGTGQALKMTLDSTGNIYVSGFSQNANSNLGYITVKYAPNGTQVWATRYDSTNYPSATPSGFALDNSNNVAVTGNALTIKYDTNGNQLWTAPYDGNAVAIDSGGNSVVTGFASGFNTEEISPMGTNLWMATYEGGMGPISSQVALVDSLGNAYIAGSLPGCIPGYCSAELLIVKYDQNGNQLWTETYSEGDATVGEVQVEGITFDAGGNVCLLVNFVSVGNYTVVKYDTNGDLIWTSYLDQSKASTAHGLASDSNSDVVFTGQQPYKYTGVFSFVYCTYKVSANGVAMWTNEFPNPSFGSSAANAIAVDNANNVYVTGYSSGTNAINAIVTIKYDQNGNQIWVQRYNGPGNGNAAGNAIAVDNNGNVYVAGYDTTTAGGTEMVLIKYSPVTLQRKPDGTVLLETQGSPGESFDIEASADLLNWLDLGSVLADTNGLLQFDDTNAPNYPARFYYANPQ
jgi:outer membrane protein assembly factor BamB